MSELSTAHEAIGEVDVIAPLGRVSSATAKAFEEAVMPFATKASPKLVFDLSGLDYISSAGLRVVLLAGKKVRASGGTLVLAALKPSIQDVFEISGFIGLFEVRDTRDAAIAAC
ncbi:MAG: STAS domain-containing protein [Pseudomonadota bacterium]